MDNKNLSKVQEKITNAASQVINNVSLMVNKSAEGELAEVIILMLISLVVVVFVFWAYSLTSKQDRLCSKLNEIYKSNNNHINPIAIYDPYSMASYSPTNIMYDPSGGNARIFSFYVKTAYNCCSPGNFSNSFVSLCALRHCISLGARCLDFEIYSLDTEPVISTSTLSNDLATSFFIKETFNSLNLVLTTSSIH